MYQLPGGFLTFDNFAKWHSCEATLCQLTLCHMHSCQVTIVRLTFQGDNLPVDHQLTICQMTILSVDHLPDDYFAAWQFCQLKNFASWQLRQLTTSPVYNFASLKFASWQFAIWQFARWLFASWQFNQLSIC